MRQRPGWTSGSSDRSRYARAKPLAIGRGKPRVLLTRLLLDPGRTVPADKLIDALWGERPPPTATKALHVYVRELRRTLGPGRIVTQGSGYQLRAEPEEIDARRFEALAERGRAAVAAGDPAGGAAHLREALGQWRGAALADAADEPFARGEAARLEDLRLGALEDRIAADLQLGRHVECAGELERLVAEHPLRERLHGQLMLALYRSGRQADALAAYRRARRVLVDELGLEPGPELQAVERSILAHDPALEPSAPPPATSPGPERKLATVVVIELAAASGDADSERLAARLARGRKEAAETLRAAGGQVELGIGGSLLAAFGAPAAQEDHAERALHAALVLRENADPAVVVRIGVESGEVLAEGAAVAGVPVSTAARLAGAAPPGAIVVGDARGGRRPRRFRLEDGVLVGAVDPRRAARLRGRRAGVRGPSLRARAARRDVGARGRQPPAAPRHDRRRRRDRQDEPARGAARAARTRRSRGTSGAASPTGARSRTGRSPRSRDSTSACTPPRTPRQSGSGSAIVASSRRSSGLEPDADLHPWEARERLRAAWVDLLDDLAANGPAVAWIEDLHWADDALLELLEQGLREATGPLLLVATARPELLGRRPAWGGGSSDASRLHLEPLGAEDAAAMLERLAPGLPEDVAAQVLDRAEGNPFFVEEALASLLDRGALRRTASGWAADGVPAALAVSDSVQAVIAARIDLLPAADKRALQAAAVIGRTFWEGAVRALAGSPSTSLALLVERDFVRRAQRVRGARRARVLVQARAHARGGVRLGAGGGPRTAARRLRHLARASGRRTGRGRPHAGAPLRGGGGARVMPTWRGSTKQEHARDLRARAVTWMRRAAELATGRYAIDDALALLAGARELEPDPAAKAELWHATATAHRFVYDIDAFRVAIEEAVALAPDAPVAARAYAELGHAGSQPWMWRDPPATEVVDGWIASALERAAGDDAARAMALDRAGRRRARVREPGTQARRWRSPSASASRSSARRRSTRRSWSRAAKVESATPPSWAERGVENAPAVPDRNQRSGTLLLATIARLWVGRIAEARQLAAEHDALATPLGAHNAVHAVAAPSVRQHRRGRLVGDARDRAARGVGVRSQRGHAVPVQLALAAHARARPRVPGRGSRGAAARGGRRRPAGGGRTARPRAGAPAAGDGAG